MWGTRAPTPTLSPGGPHASVRCRLTVSLPGHYSTGLPAVRWTGLHTCRLSSWLLGVKDGM